MYPDWAPNLVRASLVAAWKGKTRTSKAQRKATAGCIESVVQRNFPTHHPISPGLFYLLSPLANRIDWARRFEHRGLDNLTWYYPNWDFGPISCPEDRPVRWSVNRASQIRVPNIRVSRLGFLPSPMLELSHTWVCKHLHTSIVQSKQYQSIDNRMDLDRSIRTSHSIYNIHFY